MAYDIDFLRNVSASGPGVAYRTEGRDLAIVQVSGSFNSVQIALEGRVIDDGAWERIGIFWTEEPAETLSSIKKVGIYECPIFGLVEIRFNVLAINGGNVTVEGIFYDASNGNIYPYETEGENMIQMGKSNLFVKGVAEQIFMDPATGNIVGYDRTATNASVATQVNLQEIVGGMGNRLVGVLPDTVRINGTYESAAFSMQTREKIMGGQIAYDAVAAVCEKITADDSGELTVSQKPAPFYGEDSLPDIKTPNYVEISNEQAALFNAVESVPIDSYIINIEPSQPGSGDPSPTNVQPILGWTEARVLRSGKNLLTLDGLTKGEPSSTSFGNQTKRTFQIGTYVTNLASTNYYQNNSVTAESVNSEQITVTSTAPAYGLSIPLVNLKVGQTYTLSAETDGGSLNVSYYKTDGTFIGMNNSPAGFTVPDETYYTLLHFRATAANVPATFSKIQLECSSSATDYEPYIGDVYDITFPSEAGTVYGGTLDVTQGVLVVNRAMIASYAGETLPGSWISDRDVYVPGAVPTTGAQVVYELATPVSYPVTPQQITTLLGINMISSDCGAIQYLKFMNGWNIVEADGNVFRAYVRESGVSTYTGEAYGVDAKTRKVVGFVPEEGTTYEVTYYTHNASASMLPIPTMWNPVVMTVQVKYGVYAKQGVGDTQNRGVLKGWLYFIVPRAMLTADAGVNASQTGTATTDGSWMALTNKAENLPMCTDCDGNSDPMAYYVYVPCGDTNESVSAILSIGGGMALSVGQQKQLPIKLLMPDDTLVQPDFTTLNYTSDDETVATVSNLGVVAGVGTGTTFVNSFYTKDDGTVLSCKTMVVIA